jgi:DNA invertase Pin-like site-specific DNA recombinase
MRVAIYLRVSTKEQETDNQLPALRQWISGNGHELVALYREDESAWHSGHQHELSKLMAALPKYQPKILLVWALDRLTRQGIGPILQLVSNFRVHGVQVVSYSEQWTNQPPGPTLDLLYALAGWAANFEAKRISERTLAGLERARAGGKHLGRPAGSKDKKKRKRFGYFKRYATKKSLETENTIEHIGL